MPSNSAARPTFPRSFSSVLLIRSFSVSRRLPSPAANAAAVEGAGSKENSSGPTSSPCDKRTARSSALGSSCELPEEQFRERGQIVGPLPKRRNLQDDRVDSEVEIGPECLLLYVSVEVLVRGGDQADVDLALAHVAEAPEFLLLQHLQELRLDGERHVPDLVEKERPLVRDLEKAELGGDRAGESALLVPEELALQELRRKPGAIQVQEALLAARPVAVNPGREDAFAGPRLSVDEDRDVRAGDTLRPIAEEADRRTRAAEGIDLPPRLTRFVL